MPIATQRTAKSEPLPQGTRLLIVLIFFAVLLNYVDRGAIAVGAPLMKPELGLSATRFGIAVSAFFWVYAPIQFFAGWAVDRWCVYRILAAGVALWAAATMLTSLVHGLAVLIVLRLFLGLGEGFTFPAANKVIARHVSPDRRGIASSAIGMGLSFGPAIGTLIGGLITAAYGWRPMFLFFGAITLLWIGPWLASARKLPSFAPGGREIPVPLPSILRQAPVWWMGLVHATATWGHYFILTWLPLFVVQQRGMDIRTMAWVISIGLAGQGVSALLMGIASDRWTRAGRDEAAFRRWSMVACQLVIAVGVVGLMQAQSRSSIIAWMLVVCAAAAGSGVHNYVVGQMFGGPRASGSFIGIMNGLGNFSGIVGPIVTGMIIDATGSYDGGFLLTAAIAVLGAILWGLLLPPIKQISLA